jgi:hypothetical protein
MALTSAANVLKYFFCITDKEAKFVRQFALANLSSVFVSNARAYPSGASLSVYRVGSRPYPQILPRLERLARDKCSSLFVDTLCQ